MTTPESTVQEIEISMEAIKSNIRKGEVLTRLCENADFKELILDGFMGEKRLQDLLTKKVSPAFQSDSNKLYVDTQTTAIGALRMFMLLTEQEAAMAKDALVQAQEELDRVEGVAA